MMVNGEGEAQSAGAYVDGVLGGAMAKEAFGRYGVSFPPHSKHLAGLY